MRTQNKKDNIPTYLLGGTNVSNYIISRSQVDSESTIGFYLGIGVKLKINSKWSFHPRLLFSTQGNESVLEGIQTIDENGQLVDINLAIRNEDIMLQVPLLMNMYLLNKLSVEIGPQIGYALDKKSEVISSPIVPPDNDVLAEEYNRLVLGLEYKIYKKWSISMNYIRGIIELDNSYRSSVFRIGVNYML